MAKLLCICIGLTKFEENPEGSSIFCVDLTWNDHEPFSSAWRESCGTFDTDNAFSSFCRWPEWELPSQTSLHDSLPNPCCHHNYHHSHSLIFHTMIIVVTASTPLRLYPKFCSISSAIGAGFHIEKGGGGGGGESSDAPHLPGNSAHYKCFDS